jgi:hypothetical protein
MIFYSNFGLCFTLLPCEQRGLIADFDSDFMLPPEKYQEKILRSLFTDEQWTGAPCQG